MAVVAVAFATATAFTAAAAQPAHADKVDCLNFLDIAGYPANPVRHHACEVGGSGVTGAWFLCYDELLGDAVEGNAAATACDLADSHWSG